MLHDTLPQRPETLELQKFKLNKVSVDVFPRATPEGNKPYAELSHTFKGRDGLTHTQELRLDCERIVEAAERVRTLLEQWRSENLLTRVASWFGGLVNGKDNVHEIGSFSLKNVTRDVTVQVRAVDTEKGLTPYIKLRETITRRDGKREVNAFLIDGNQFQNLADKVRPILIEEAKKLEQKQNNEQQKPRWWTVLSFEQSLGETGAIARVVDCSSERDKTFKRYHGGPYLVLSAAQPIKRLPGEKMAIAGGEDERADEWIKNAKVMEEYHKRHPRIDLSRSSLTPEERADFKPINTATVGNLKGDLVAVRGEDGKWQRTVYVTRPVTDPDGTTRHVTSEYSEAQCRAILKKADQRDQAKTQEEPGEKQSQPVRLVKPPFAVGDLLVHLIERRDEKGQPERSVVLTRTQFRPDGTIKTDTAEYTVAQFRTLYSQGIEQKPEKQLEQPQKIAPPKASEPQQTPELHPHNRYINKMLAELRQQYVFGVWYGVEPPKKNDLVRWESGLSYVYEGDDKRGKMKEEFARVSPMNGLTIDGQPLVPQFVVGKRTAHEEFIYVIGATKNLDYVRTKVEEFEAARAVKNGHMLEVLAKAKSLLEAQKPEHSQPKQLPRPEQEQHHAILLSR